MHRGTDLLKAMALGASCVFIGRPFNYAACVGGEPGVAHAIDLMQKEVSRGMAYLGIKSLDEINANCLIDVARGGYSSNFYSKWGKCRSMGLYVFRVLSS